MSERNNNKNDGNIKIPEPSLRRLPGYLSYCKSLSINGAINVSSSQIAAAFNMDATLVTKDLSHTGVKGRTKIGYDIESLTNAIIDFLDFNVKENAYIFGIGNLGKALINYKGLAQYGLKIIAGFDISEDLVNSKINNVPIYHINDLFNYSKTNKAKIGIITTPEFSAQETADMLVESGVKAIWNFTPKAIKVPDNIIIENNSIYSDLAVIFNRLNKA